MKERSKYRLFLALGTTIFVIFVVAIIILSIIDSKKTARLQIVVAPSFAKVEIDGKKYTTDGEYKFEPGTYKATITADDFTAQEVEIELKSSEKTYLATYLVPSNGSMDWYVQHPSEDMILSAIGSINSSLISDAYQEKYPVSAILPIVYASYDQEYNYTEYRIDGGKFEDCKSDFCIKITDTTGGNKDAALMQIRDKGFDPNAYEVLYEYVPIQPLN